MTNALRKNYFFLAWTDPLPFQFLRVARTFASGIVDHSESLTACAVHGLQALEAKSDRKYPVLPYFSIRGSLQRLLLCACIIGACAYSLCLHNTHLEPVNAPAKSRRVKHN